MSQPASENLPLSSESSAASGAVPGTVSVLGSRPNPRRIGDVLLEMGAIDVDQLDRALTDAKATATPVGSTLLKLGYIDEATLGKALAKLHGLTYVDASDVELSIDVVKLLPEDFIKRHLVIPLALDIRQKRLEVLMVRPDNLRVLDEVALLTGYRPIPRVSTYKEVSNLIYRYFKQSSSEDALKKLKEDFYKEDTIYGDALDTKQIEAEMAQDDAPVVQVVNSILAEAIDSNASDVHIEPQKERLLVRYRIDGILHEAKSIPREMGGALVSRIKIASGMDIAERRRPQDGRMKLAMGGNEIDMRVNSISLQFGEKIVIRLLRSTMTSGRLETLGFSKDEITHLRKMIRTPNGIILVTGPTGSGKTTTLYSCLRELNTIDRNITTIEDPIEHPIAGINQTQISSKAGLTFSLSLRSILRQDPDVIMVGEIRDEETLQSAIQAALTGHLVFSTVHTNSTSKTITRLVEMGAPHFLLSSTLVGILAQRLVRKICARCKTSYTPSFEELQLLGLKLPPEKVTLYKGAGCSACDNSGYHGRVGLFEIMPMTRDIQELIDQKASSYTIQDAAVRDGMLTLNMDGKRKVMAGLTTLEEVTRILGYDLEA